MSEQIESQSSAPQEPIELSGESQVEDQQQNQHGAQRGGRNGKGGQQRGGRYGSNKYNHGNNIIDIMETIWVVVVEIITITVISHTEVI